MDALHARRIRLVNYLSTAQQNANVDLVLSATDDGPVSLMSALKSDFFRGGFHEIQSFHSVIHWFFRPNGGCPVNSVCLTDFDTGLRECQCRRGFSGVDCDHDIDECSRNKSICPQNSNCVNTIGGYYCQCLAGFRLVGRQCAIG